MNKSRYLLLIVILVMFLFINKYVLDYIEHAGDTFYMNQSSHFPTIYDILHKVLPHIPMLEHMSDIICVSLLLSLVVLDKTIFYYFLGFILTIFIIRSVTIFVTVLPKNKKCNVKHASMFRGGCYDKIFSGHFATGLLATLMLYSNNYINMIFLLLINFLNALFIILSRNHYTIDIIVALFITLFVYTNNLTICRVLDKYI